MLCKDHFPKFGSILITCLRYLTRFDPMMLHPKIPTLECDLENTKNKAKDLIIL